MLYQASLVKVALSATIAEICDAFACSSALESLATDQARAGDALATTLDNLRQLAADQPAITIRLLLSSMYIRASRADAAVPTPLLAAAKGDHERAEAHQ